MSATILIFPMAASTAPTTRLFTLAERNAIIATAWSISGRWGARFDCTESGEHIASIGLVSGGAARRGENDAFALSYACHRVEVVDFATMSIIGLYATVADALAAIRAAATL